MGMNLAHGVKHRVRPEMNVTPLVDVVLVLLIIFMVVTPLLTKKLWLAIPKQDEKAENEPPPPPDAQKPVVVRVHKDGSIRINAQPVSEADLPVRLQRILAARQDRVVFFDAEDDADYGDAVRVMDAARGAGVATIAVLTEPMAP